MKLSVKENTVFKKSAIPSSRLDPSQKISVNPSGGPRQFALTSVQAASDKHILITLTEPLGGRLSWFVFVEHVELLLEEDHPLHSDAQEPPIGPSKEGQIVLPGKSGPVDLESPIIPGGNFSWAEATKNGERIPVTAKHTANIEHMAHRMEEVRKELGGHPIRITSWYRDPESNRAVGGVENSQHLTGLAVDFYIDMMPDDDVQAVLNPIWEGGLGFGRTFTHVDDRGYVARFNYGN
jgi:hypothetical protein